MNITVASTFSSTVNASTLDIDTDAGAKIVTFDGNVTGGAWNIETGGDNGDTAAVKFRGNATLTSLNIDKEDANAEATVTFDESSAQSIAGNITTTANNDGVLVISNTHNNGVTFGGSIGTSGGNKAVSYTHLTLPTKA